MVLQCTDAFAEDHDGSAGSARSDGLALRVIVNDLATIEVAARMVSLGRIASRADRRWAGLGTYNTLLDQKGLGAGDWRVPCGG